MLLEHLAGGREGEGKVQGGEGKEGSGGRGRSEENGEREGERSGGRGRRKESRGR